MKKNETGDFCILYLEPSDDKTTFMNVITGQQKTIVIILTEHTRLFQRPEDFTALKHVKRQLNLSLIFVIPNGEHLVQLANRNGFPVYSSMDALSDALTTGHLGRQRVFNKTTASLDEKTPPASPQKTVPLTDPTITFSQIASSTPEQAMPVQMSPAHSKQPFLEQMSPVSSSHRVQPEQAVPQQTVSTPAQPRGRASRQLPPMPEYHPEELPEYTRQSNQSGASPKRRFPSAMLTLMLFAVVLAAVGSFLVFSNKLPTSNTTSASNTVGYIAFQSSEQLSENNSQGIEDQVVIDLNNLPQPHPGKAYYAWLLGDKTQPDLRSIALGALSVQNGHAHLFYPGDAQHTNLLLITSRFLVTEEDSTMPPITPSPDLSAWRYYGEFAQTPLNLPGDTQPYSYLDHLRHLLASDPTMDELELPGGLNSWLYRNSGQVLEWTGSTREQWEDRKDVDFVRRQTTRTLTYLDGMAFIRKDLAPKAPTLVNERLARIGILNVAGPNQDPPDYLSHIDRHLSGLIQTGKVSDTERQKIAGIVAALNNVKFWYNQVRQDALKILKMSDAQLKQASTLNLLNDMIDNANHAYVGQQDPNTGQMQQGVVWIHQQIEGLATMNIAPFSSKGSAMEMVPDTLHFTAFVSKN